jgi:3-oxoacyl-(acyl-carrier-protein) synthase
VIKAVLVLENGIIPPNANFEKLNPKIDADYLRLKVGHPTLLYLLSPTASKVALGIYFISRIV